MKLKAYPLVFALMILSSCTAQKDLSTVENVDLKKYQGTWYEIARLPNSFEKGLKCITATYSLKENGKVDVLNRGFNTKKEKWENANGVARVPDGNYPGRLRVSFFWPFGGDYYIIRLDENYQHVLVGSPTRDYLWILARQQELETETYNSLVKAAKDLGFNVDELITVVHDCD